METKYCERYSSGRVSFEKYGGNQVVLCDNSDCPYGNHKSGFALSHEIQFCTTNGLVEQEASPNDLEEKTASA